MHARPARPLAIPAALLLGSVLLGSGLLGSGLLGSGLLGSGLLGSGLLGPWAGAARPAAAEEERATPDVARVLAQVLPDKRDLAWTRVPWRATLWDAVIEAHEKKKPILLWAMNGHALACT